MSNTKLQLRLQQVGAITGLLALALVFGAYGFPTPAAHALTDADISAVVASNTNAIDTQVKGNLVTVSLWLIGMVFVFGLLGIVLIRAHRGLRTLSGAGR